MPTTVGLAQQVSLGHGETRNRQIHAFLSVLAEQRAMSFEKDDTAVLHDKHSEFDGETGTITQVVENMFGDATYTISFEDGQETGVPEESLEAADDE